MSCAAQAPQAASSNRADRPTDRLQARYGSRLGRWGGVVEALWAPPASAAQQHRRRVPVVLFAALAVVLALTLLAAAEWYQRNREMAALLDATEASEAAMLDFQTDSKRLAELAPRTSTDQFQDPAAVRAQVQAAAGDAAAQVITTGDDVRDLFILPWHRSLTKAQERYLAHSDAWQDYLEGVAGNFDVLLERHPQISGTFLSAGKAYRDAVPPLPLHDAPARVEDIFDE
jgi:hypothetical protein